MKSLDLKIADYNIRLETTDKSVELCIDKRFRKFISHNDPDEEGIKIFINKEEMYIPVDAERVYNALFSAADNTNKGPDFWSVWKKDTSYFLKLAFPSHSSEKAILKFSMESPAWELWVKSDSKSFDPLEYPLDSLVLYYLSVINKDIMIHASGVDYNGSGFLFSGVSGRGKTTMAQLWDKMGGRVIHDDRLIIRRKGEKYEIHNTPVYSDDEPRSSVLNRIYVIEHGTKNDSTLLKGAQAVSLVMANCIQHNWGRHIIGNLLESITDLCRNVPVYKLSFRPDESITEYIIRNG